MKKLLIPILTMLVASPALAAQQNISTITTKTSREALRTAVNTELGKVQANTTELYSLAIAAPWLAQATAPSITNVFWVDTSGTSPVIKYWDGDSWEVAASGEGGTYTLPIATASVLGGVKQGTGTSIAADGTLSVTKSGLGLGTTDNAVFGSVNAAGGTLSAGVANTTQGTLVLYTNTNPVYAFGLSPAASPSASVSLKAPAGMPTADNSLFNCDINGTCDWTAPSTFLTPSGSGASLTVDASGFNGNLATTDNTLQEIAQKVDDLTAGSGTDDQTASEVDITDAGLYFTGTTVEAALQEVGLGYAKKADYLALANTTAFTPDADYEPATKKYVDDAITAGGGYTDEMAQDAVGGMFTGNTETGITVTYDDATAKTNFVVSTQFDGTQSTTGSAATLTTARTIGGVSFNGSANINLPGVNTSGTQNTSGTAAGLTAQYIDWNSASGGSSIANKPTIPTASSLSVDDLITLSGVAGGAVNLGTFTGATIADNSTVKTAIQAVETAVETKANASSIAFEAATWADLKILDTTHTTAGTGIALVQDSMAYADADDAYHLWSIDKIGSELAGKQATIGMDTSAELRTLVTDESGTGALLFAGGDIAAATATTPAANDNDTSVATTAYVQTELSAYASDAITKTNLTLDTAGTGNAITVPLNGVLDGAITDPADADDMIYKKVQNAMTLTDIHCLAEGGGTITLTLQECTTAGASCANIETAITCDADGAEDDGTMSDASIAAGAWVKVLYSAPTGTVNNVSWTVYGTQTW